MNIESMYSTKLNQLGFYCLMWKDEVTKMRKTETKIPDNDYFSILNCARIYFSLEESSCKVTQQQQRIYYVHVNFTQNNASWEI